MEDCVLARAMLLWYVCVIYLASTPTSSQKKVGAKVRCGSMIAEDEAAQKPWRSNFDE